MTTRCAFLVSAEDHGEATGMTRDDRLAALELEAEGVEVTAVSWGGPAPDVDLVVVRSPWDYVEHVDDFLEVLASWQRSGVRIANRPQLVAWNARKTYLAELERAGVPIVPTRFLDARAVSDADRLGEAVDATVDETGAAVLKPTVGASARQTFVVSGGVPEPVLASYRARPGSGALVQPRVDSVLSEGEYSVVFFGDRLSHVVLKTPRSGDFRVQEEFGGRNRTVSPESSLLQAAEEALRCSAEIGDDGVLPLYARVDLVRAAAGEWWLMEMELIEPELLLRHDEAAPRRFAQAIIEEMR